MFMSMIWFDADTCHTTALSVFCGWTGVEICLIYCKTVAYYFAESNPKAINMLLLLTDSYTFSER